MTALAERLERSAAVRAVLEGVQGAEAWLVGGTVRDALRGDGALDEPDLVVSGDAERAARAIADRAGAFVFPLSERFGAWRVIARDRTWQSDVAAVRGTIEEDLALRDFTINAMAVPAGDPGRLIDSHGGEQDLGARMIRAVGPRSFADDPLRALRMVRFACDLDFEVEPETGALAAAAAAGLQDVAPERSFYELRRLVAGPAPRRGIELMDSTGLVAVLLPELDALKGVEQNPYHHLDVWGHTLAVLDQVVDVTADLGAALGESGEGIARELAEPLGDELTRGQALRFGALLHDVGKPATRAVTDEGRVLFWGHDSVGADMSRAFGRRMHTSSALAEYTAALAQHHLHLGFLVHEQPLSRRHVYRYMRKCEPVEVEVTVLSVADRLATLGPRTREEAVESHLSLARELAGEALAWRTGQRPHAPVGGDDVIAELGIQPGPEVGRLLEAIDEAAFAGEVQTRDDALALARREAASRT
ncbi:MAG TPA: HD domain-containing protein [Solirubrobacterales bacterium]|nr:HD domain-containing protein [Solirubrobacterales bacterium]